LRDRAAEAEKQYKGWLDDYQKANEEYRKLVESANDQAVSSEEREKRKKSAESKLLELNELEKTLAQFKRETHARFEEQRRRMRDQIVREIRDLINSRARTAGFTLVLDTSAESINAAPFILYSAGNQDLTEELLKQLNANAPPGVLDVPSKESSLTLPDQSKPAEPEKPVRGFRR
jgi:Skp family chaperone for outer membrane proteins